MPPIPHYHHRTSSAVYALARIDASGRITDNTTPKALTWPPGQALRTTVIDHVSITLQPDHNGTAKICTRGHAVLPAHPRRRCGITAGDLMLLIALPDRELLRIHTLTYLDTILASQIESQ